MPYINKEIADMLSAQSYSDKPVVISLGSLDGQNIDVEVRKTIDYEDF